MKRLFPALVACLVVALVYAPVVRHGFVWDDYGVVLGKRSVVELDWLGMVSRGLWDDVDGFAGETPYFRPLLVLSFGLDRLLSDSAAWFVHAQCLAWHLVNVALLARLLVRSVGGFTASVVAILVGLHPTVVEAVAFAAARNDLMITTFLLLAISLARGATGRGWFVAACGALAMACKESALVLPFVLFFVSGDRRRGAGMAVASALGVGAVLIARFILGIHAPSVGGLSVLELGRVALCWLGWMVWPGQVAPMAGAGCNLNATMAVGAATGVGLLWLAARNPRVRGPVAAAILVLLPAMPAAVLSGLYSPRYLYTPLFLLALAVPALRSRVLSRVGMVGFALAAGWQTGLRLPEWSDNLALFRANVDRAPNARSWKAFGDALREHGDPAGALGAFDTALDFPHGADQGCLKIAGMLGAIPDAAAQRMARWEHAGCRKVVGFDDSALWNLAGAGKWAEVIALSTTQRVADATGRGNAVRGALRLSDGDWDGLMAGALRDSLGPTHYVDAAYGVHLAVPTE